ncbi:MAG: hypothetical protein ACFHWZ_16835 [Phycisphaerales bacterium]
MGLAVAGVEDAIRGVGEGLGVGDSVAVAGEVFAGGVAEEVLYAGDGVVVGEVAGHAVEPEVERLLARGDGRGGRERRRAASCGGDVLSEQTTEHERQD